MCGGSGTRLWPLSRKVSPKQFVPLFNEVSLFQKTIERNMNIVDDFIVVVNEDQLPLCQAQIPKVLKDKVTYIVEPVGRNTAPAITLATLLAEPKEELLILASDHLIQNTLQYENSVQKAIKLAKEHQLVTFGITPEYPETGYGYIEAKETKVLSFKEKPNTQTAQEYIARGNFYWNSGMFCFTAETYLKELQELSNEILEKSKIALTSASKENNIIRILKSDMMDIPEDSIDYAVMEKSHIVSVVPADMGWTDLGSFDSLYNVMSKDSEGNVVQGNYISLNSSNNLIIGNKKLITTFDIKNLIIVDTPDALLIGKRGKGQHVKTLLQKVKSKFAELL